MRKLPVLIFICLSISRSLQKKGKFYNIIKVQSANPFVPNSYQLITSKVAPAWALKGDHLVNVPLSGGFSGLTKLLTYGARHAGRAFYEALLARGAVDQYQLATLLSHGARPRRGPATRAEEQAPRRARLRGVAKHGGEREQHRRARAPVCLPDGAERRAGKGDTKGLPVKRVHGHDAAAEAEATPEADPAVEAWYGYYGVPYGRPYTPYGYGQRYNRYYGGRYGNRYG